MWSDCLLDLDMDFLIGNMAFVRDMQYLAEAGFCNLCVVSFESMPFPWLVFFFGDLLRGSMIHKHTGR